MSGYRPVGRDSSVDTAIRHWLGGPEIESWWGRDFPHPSRTAMGLLYKWVLGRFPGVKRLGRIVDLLPPSGAEVKERVELYLYFPCGPPSQCIFCVYFRTDSDYLFIYTKLTDWIFITGPDVLKARYELNIGT
jgi:hypothetical protein